MFFKLWLLFALSTATIVLASTEKKTYVIHMDKAKMSALDQSLGETKKWHDAVIDSIAKLSTEEKGEQEPVASDSPELLYVYEKAISGIAVKLTDKQVESLKKIEGFLYATPDNFRRISTTYSPQFLGLQNGKGLWSTPNLVSEVIIGVVDSGIWPEHGSFRDSSQIPPVPSKWKGACEAGTKFSPSNCNRKLIGARSYSKGYEAGGGVINGTDEYRSPRDANGHGTHTASTAGGNVVTGANTFGLAKGTASGMSYAARIAVYKTCWGPAGNCADSDMLAAIDQSITDGVDVLSISVGFDDQPYYKDQVAIATFGAIRSGIFVSVAAGNSGPVSSSIANTAPWMMTVAASYTDRKFPTMVKLGDGQSFEGSSQYTGKPAKKFLPLVYGKNAGGENAEYCVNNTLSPKLVKGKIVACEEGGAEAAELGMHVKSAGGVGMLLLVNDIYGEELTAEPFTLPASSLTASSAHKVRTYLTSAGKKASASIFFNGTVYGAKAPAMAAFSSRGPSSVDPYVIKPDVTAPGVNILAAWPANISPTEIKTDKRRVIFNIISGTSMACPHVSGLAALLKSVHKDWSPAAIKSALMTTASTLDQNGAPIKDVATSDSANPFAFGSGHVNPERASDPGLIYDITSDDYLNHLCSLGYNSSTIAPFLGGGRTSFNCPRSIQPVDLNYPSFSFVVNPRAISTTVRFKRTVTNVGAANDTYSSTVQLPPGVNNVSVTPGRLNFKQLGQKLSYTMKIFAFGGIPPDNFTFGSITWKSAKHTVSSPIVVTWKT